MADLPEPRVTIQTRAFMHTGMDGFGPMGVKIGRRVEKRYGLILTCLSTRAIHLELLHSLSTDSAILGIRRFISRRVDYDDPDALTPKHFLIGSSSPNPILGEFTDDDRFLRRQWQFFQKLADQFWRRWKAEYLPTLLRRKKWNREERPLKVSDVVILTDDAMPRNSWTKGIVVAVFPGKDGRIRVVEVKTSTGVNRRPVAKLIILDVCKSE
ncbi:unnamed protein product [Allacma fusca]|uniref:DUF5641 domain-containing protein n=1 Tax=Allacma fusca TaxID=39272 RepID=A0A8J2KE55_9HEXA|nr:unnamed protein product [Allacma fusca]